EKQKRAHLTVVVLVQAYYAFTLVLFVRWLSHYWPIWLKSEEFRLLWPVVWIGVDPIPAIYFLGVVVLGSGVLAVLFPTERWIRFLVFLALLLFVAMWNSFGKINHSLHAWLWIALIFVFLPDEGWHTKNQSISKRQPFLFVFWGAQVLFALFYSMSGIIKIYAAVHQILNSQVSVLHPYALAYVVANRLLQNGDESLLGPLIVAHPLWGWPFYLTAVLLESLALVAVIRPSLHRFWGIGLFLLHMSNWLILSVLFPDQILLCLLLLVYSPYRSQNLTLRRVIQQIPLVGVLFKRKESV
ncbi:MAG: hypothetical protein DWI57_16030, partial [Chloroflexi bacterium]